MAVDLKELAVLLNAADHFEWHGANSLMDIMRSCPRPIIGEKNFAITGIKIALWCDFLIAAKSARFGDTHARVGITQPRGLAQLLPRVIGISRAKQISLIGEMIGAKTAQAWGLVNEVTIDQNLLQRAWDLAALIAEIDITTMGKIKTLVDASKNTGLDEGLK